MMKGEPTMPISNESNGYDHNHDNNSLTFILADYGIRYEQLLLERRELESVASDYYCSLKAANSNSSSRMHSHGQSNQGAEKLSPSSAALTSASALESASASASSAIAAAMTLNHASMSGMLQSAILVAGQGQGQRQGQYQTATTRSFQSKAKSSSSTLTSMEGLTCLLEQTIHEHHYGSSSKTTSTTSAKNQKKLKKSGHGTKNGTKNGNDGEKNLQVMDVWTLAAFERMQMGQSTTSKQDHENHDGGNDNDNHKSDQYGNNGDTSNSSEDDSYNSNHNNFLEQDDEEDLLDREIIDAFFNEFPECRTNNNETYVYHAPPCTSNSSNGSNSNSRSGGYNFGGRGDSDRDGDGGDNHNDDNEYTHDRGPRKKKMISNDLDRNNTKTTTSTNNRNDGRSSSSANQNNRNVKMSSSLPPSPSMVQNPYAATTRASSSNSSSNRSIQRQQSFTNQYQQHQHQQQHTISAAVESSWDVYNAKQNGHGGGYQSSSIMRSNPNNTGQNHDYNNNNNNSSNQKSKTNNNPFCTAKELKQQDIINVDGDDDDDIIIDEYGNNPANGNGFDYQARQNNINPYQQHHQQQQQQQPQNQPYNPNRPNLSAGLKRKYQPPKRGLGNTASNKNTTGGGHPITARSSSSTTTTSQSNKNSIASANDEEQDDLPEELRGLDKELIAKIENEIVDSGDPITFKDIAGLEDAKQTVLELVCWPMKRPDLFTGLRRGPNGLLLFGPPGTGKTLIGKAIAHESGATFFSISSSSLTSKWIGEGEKLVRTLFGVAAYREPSVVFIDEIDSLLTQRKADENEASRRIKTEFLVQLDGTGTSGQGRVLAIGATNRPNELDDAARRRFVKRLYIPLPEEPDRIVLLTSLLAKNKHGLSEKELRKTASETKGFSGADLKALCTDAALGPIRELGPKALEVAAADVPPISYRHFKRALRGMNPSVAKSDLDLYKDWNATYGTKSMSADDYAGLSDDDDDDDNGDASS